MEGMREGGEIAGEIYYMGVESGWENAGVWLKRREGG